MRRWIRLLMVGSILVGPAAGTAFALSLVDLLKLKAAGISDDVLVAVVEADRTVYQLTPDDIVMLRGKGFSDKLIIAMLQTITRGQPAPAPQLRPDKPDYLQLQLQHPPQAPAPVVVNVTQTVEQHVEQPRPETQVVYQSVPYPVFVNRAPARTREPDPVVYWGFGGQRRTDSWSTPQIERNNERARQNDKKNNDK